MPNLESKLASVEAYASSVALNNMGISLLEGRCYQEAVAIFQDAIAAFPTVDAHYLLPLGKQRRHPTLAEVEHKLYRASLSLANEEPPQLIRCDVDESESECDGDGNSSDFLWVLNEKGDNVSFSTTGAQSNPATLQYVFYLLGVQHFDTDSAELNSEQLSQTFALILHNQGQAYVSLSKLYEADDLTRSDNLLEVAAKFFHVSRAVIDTKDHSVSPVLSAAMHRTMLQMERHLGIYNNSSQAELVDYGCPTAAKRKDSPLTSMSDKELDEIICGARHN